MTLLYDSPLFLKHDTGSHPECAERLARVSRKLADDGWAKKCARPTWQPIGREAVGRIHNLGYVDIVRKFAQRGGGFIESDTVVGPESYQVALSAAGAAADAVRKVVQGEDRTALCLVRPPGHHAVKSSAMGFCLFNNIAIATRVACDDLGVERVLIVDWDVHHGNGTQEAFWEDPQVGFLSIHRSPFYPGSGREDETGGGDGLGTVRNLPIRFGTPRADYMARFSAALEELAGKIRPQLVMVSAGFDSHRQDPIGSLGLETEDFQRLTNLVLDVADQYAGGKAVSLLEGGYNLDVLPDCVQVHLESLLARPAK